MPYTPAQTWASWNGMYYATNATTNVQLWAAWNQGYYTAQTNVVGNWSQPAPTEAEMRAIAERATEARKVHDAARARAEEFLLEHLDPGQRESWHKDKLFIVETRKKRRYALYLNEMVHRLEGDRRVERYCIHTHGVPREDELLGFKLLLEADEDQFLHTANATRIAA